MSSLEILLLRLVRCIVGRTPAVEVETLNAKGSLFLTRPSLAAHTANAQEYRQRADDVLAAVAAGIIKYDLEHLPVGPCRRRSSNRASRPAPSC